MIAATTSPALQIGKPAACRICPPREAYYSPVYPDISALDMYTKVGGSDRQEAQMAESENGFLYSENLVRTFSSPAFHSHSSPLIC